MGWRSRIRPLTGTGSQRSGQGQTALRCMAPLSGLHRLLGNAASDLEARPRRSHPQRHLARLPRDPDGGVRSPGRSRAQSAVDPGGFVLVVEGSLPTKEQGIYMKLAGKPALQVLQEVGAKAAAIIAIGSCASWGGVPSADPNPTGAMGVDSIIKDKPIVNIPGCPPNPYTLMGVVLQFARYVHAARARRREAPEVRLRPRHSRPLPAPRPFRRGTLRNHLRRRGTPPGLVPLQDGLQRPRYPCRMLYPALQRNSRRLADRHRRALYRLHRTNHRLPHPSVRNGSHPPCHARRYLSRGPV